MKSFGITNLFFLLGVSNIAVMASPINPDTLARAVADGDLIPAANVTEIDKRDCGGCGVYLCSENDFQGDCFWGCYGKNAYSQIPAGWRARISSVGPDQGCHVTLGTPDYQSCEGFDYPGGNLKSDSDCRGNAGNFYCIG